MKLLSILHYLTASHASMSTNLRGNSTAPSIDRSRRQLASYYYSTSSKAILGEANPDAAIGNPLKGLLTSPRWTGNKTPQTVPSSLEFYYIGFDEIMNGSNQFNWTVLDTSLSDAAARNNHVIWRVFCHYPGQPLRVPQYLIDAGVKLVPISDGTVSPQYDDPILLKAFQQFIASLGKRYDGHKSLGFIQLGLLGYWGEWHTYPDTNLISAATIDKVVGWYDAAFQTTQLQVRTPVASAYAAGMGLHDDSFGFSTTGSVDWFFWPSVEKAGQTQFWKKGAMGGETRPELQATIFEPGYQPGSDQYKQDFMKCVNVTHATYMFHHNAFQGGLSGTELTNARRAHAQMGYNFRVTSVGVATSTSGTVSVDITVEQIGVAPFYYPLSLELSCPSTTTTVSGVEGLIGSGDSKVFTFQDIPASSSCLNNVAISLKSDFVSAGRPVKFAQGSDGKVLLKLPLPQNGNPAPSPSPVATAAPAPSTGAPPVEQPPISGETFPEEPFPEDTTPEDTKRGGLFSWLFEFLSKLGP
jgi:hypothetical protein